MFSRKSSEPAVPVTEPPKPSVTQPPPSRPVASVSAGGILSRGVSIKGSVKFTNELLIDGQVEGEINSTGTLTVGEHAQIRGEIHAKSVKVKGNVEGNISATERCELQPGCTLRGDIEAPRLVVDENASFFGSAKVATKK